MTSVSSASALTRRTVQPGRRVRTAHVRYRELLKAWLLGRPRVRELIVDADSEPSSELRSGLHAAHALLPVAAAPAHPTVCEITIEAARQLA